MSEQTSNPPAVDAGRKGETMTTTTTTAPRAALQTVAEAEARRHELQRQFAERLETLDAERRATEGELTRADDMAAAVRLIERREALGRELEATRCVRRVILERAEVNHARAWAIERVHEKIAALEEALPREREADEREGAARPTPSREARVLALLDSCRERLAGYEAGDVPRGRPL